MNLTLLGEKTPRTVIYKSESHKLHQAFTPKDKNTVILRGMAVAIEEDGTISPYVSPGTGIVPDQIYLGIAVTDSINPAYREQRGFPIEVTVMVEAFAIVNWVAKEEMTCGYCLPTADTLNDRFVVAEKVDGASIQSQFINITPADAANDVIQVLVR